MEWRSEYDVVIEIDPKLNARIDVPLLSFNKWGIYYHFFVQVEEDVVKIIPRHYLNLIKANRVNFKMIFCHRFLFGIPHDTIESMYGLPALEDSGVLQENEAKDIVGRIPIIGLFSQSNTVDRIIIQVNF